MLDMVPIQEYMKTVKREQLVKGESKKEVIENWVPPALRKEEKTFLRHFRDPVYLESANRICVPNLPPDEYFQIEKCPTAIHEVKTELINPEYLTFCVIPFSMKPEPFSRNCTNWNLST